MPIAHSLRDFYKKWLEPPGVKALRTRHPELTTQKFWTGAPVSAPPRETAYFAAAGLAAVTITRGDDSRAAALVDNTARLAAAADAAGSFVQFAVTADRWRSSSALHVRAGGRTTTHTALTPGRWLDIRLPLEGGGAVEIKSDEPIWVSYPRAISTRAGGHGKARHVVVMVMDGLGRRMLSSRHPTDPSLPLLPNLDRFFANGLDAPIGFASSDWTLPTTASFFSGLFASRHGMVHPSLPMRHRQDVRLLAEYFQDAGFHTLALSTGNRLTPAFDSHRGFDRFIYHWPYAGRTTFDYDPAVWIDEILGHIELHSDDATFTYVHFPDSHPAWNVPPIRRAFNLARRGDSTGHDLDALERTPLGREQGRQLLLLRLHDLDRALGGLLDHIDRVLGDEALVVLTADHGTPWPDFLETEPKDRPSLNEMRIGTFMRLRGAGVPEGTHRGLVSPNLDLMPTLLDAIGVALPGELDGRSLLRPEASTREYLISESVYRTTYEVAVNTLDGQWIEKYPIDEQTHRLTGPCSYRAYFPLGCTDYSAQQSQRAAPLEAIVQQHLTRVGRVP